MQVLPNIIEQIGRNKKTFSIPDKLFEKNIITLFDTIDDDMAYIIITQLLYLDSIDDEDPITMYINSPGGSVTAGLAIIDTINQMQRKVNTVGMGSCASMSAMLLLCGTGIRKALKNARILLHSISGGSVGNYHDNKINFKEEEFLQKKLMVMIADKSKLNVEDIEKMTERDFIIGAAEAVELGFIDSVV